MKNLKQLAKAARRNFKGVSVHSVEPRIKERKKRGGKKKKAVKRLDPKKEMQKVKDEKEVSLLASISNKDLANELHSLDEEE